MSYLFEFVKVMDIKGFFFYGEKLGYVDIMLVFYVVRFFIFKYYCCFEVFKSEEFKRFYIWCEVVRNVFVVKVIL